MQEITFEAHGLEELQTRLNNGDTMMRISLNECLLAIGKLIVPTKGTGPLANETPKRTGKLARSTFWSSVDMTDPKNQVLTILQPARTPEEYGGHFYGWFVREGTEPHEIVPRYKKALAWGRDLGDGKREFVRARVNHPGTSPNPYHRRTLSMLMPQIQGIVTQAGLRITSYLSGKGA